MLRINHQGDDYRLQVWADAPLPAATNLLRQFEDACLALHAVVALQRFDVDRLEDQAGQYSYQFSTSDGREWNQVLRVEQDGTMMTFDVADWWRLSEFTPHRAIRELVLRLIREHQVYKIKFDWM